ncbi:DUF222 domain-containing protein [Arthrobacter sp. QXT-31]|uniref:DUF222 domain-containing protein n=1 Tax=Arthrobacter sp. QXT-31 TaxID=1357915 RepID=UPI001F1A78CE|nr:HNH endonuclease signature motif containing protein [Arthrobacter sp. QXT-31]
MISSAPGFASAAPKHAALALAGDVLPRTGLAGRPMPPIHEETAAALTAGIISSRAGTIITTALDKVRHIPDPDALAKMERNLTQTAIENDQDFLTRIAHRWIDALDQDGTEPSEENLRHRQGVFIRPKRGGLYHLEIHATTDQYEVLTTVMNTATNPRTTTPDTTSAAQRKRPAKRRRRQRRLWRRRKHGQRHRCRPGRGLQRPCPAPGSGPAHPGPTTPRRPRRRQQGGPRHRNPARHRGSAPRSWSPSPTRTSSTASKPPQPMAPATTETAPAPGQQTAPHQQTTPGTPPRTSHQAPPAGRPPVQHSCRAPGRSALPNRSQPPPRTSAKPAVRNRQRKPGKPATPDPRPIRLPARTSGPAAKTSPPPQTLSGINQSGINSPGINWASAGFNGQPGTPPGSGTFTYTGPVTASTIRKIACDADIIPVLLSSQGRILDIGRTTRIFPPHIRKALNARDQGCAFPNCTIPATWCEAHHITYWSQGGPTSTDNGVLLCTAHHHLIHKEQWKIHIKNGTPWFIPPPHIDPRQQPRQNHHHKT